MDSRVTRNERRRVLESLEFDVEDLDQWQTKYANLIRSARLKGHEVELTFAQYMQKVKDRKIGSPSEIGRARDQYQMARYNDVGNYTVDNCRYVKQRVNGREQTEHGLRAEQKGVKGRRFIVTNPRGTRL